MIENNKDTTFLKNFFTLAIPVILQNLLTLSINNVDSLMIGQMGEKAIISISIANQIFFLYTFFLNGITIGTTVFLSQYWGKKDNAGFIKSLNLCIMINILCGIIFSTAIFFFTNSIISLYTSDMETLKICSRFLKIVSITYLFIAISFSLTAGLRTKYKTLYPFIISSIALIINTVLNYLLIFGNFNFPKMGIEGSAVGILVARLFELACFIIISKKEKILNFKNLSFKKDYIFKFFSITLPGMLTSTFWSFGIITYNLIYSKLSTEWYAAINIANVIEGLYFSLFTGICIAAQTMIGNYIGKVENEKAINYSKFFLFLNLILSILLGIALILFGSKILNFYKINTLTFDYAKYLLLFYGSILWIKVLNLTLFLGILQAGGDTKYKFILSSIAMWLFGIPIMLLVCFVFKLSNNIIILFVLVEELIKLLGALLRFKSKRWIRNLVLNDSAN